ncbi:unnamed protein product [Rangifer tarandus platyrhynchus]|uniref:Uncharacterized protein n=1 Tax=Rangifer tarandus platyrhynchus TaxID=3082113 RepID=A0AC59Z8D5_RANTA
MLSGLALRTIFNCVFMVEKTKLKMQPLESTHHTFLMQSQAACSNGQREEGGGRVEGDAGQRELPLAESIRVCFAFNAHCNLCHGWLECLSFNYGIWVSDTGSHILVAKFY